MLSRYLAMAFCLTLTTACSQPQQETPIRLGINPWPGYEFLYLAQEKGFFRDVGVEVKIIEYGSLSDVRRGYERGNLDAMTTTLIEVLHVKNNSMREPQVFFVADYSNGGDVIIAKNNINNPSELAAKRIAADTTSLPIFILLRALEKSGLSLNDINLIPMEQSSIIDAFENNLIDAAVTYPPVSIELAQRDDAKIIFTSAEIPGEVLDVISAEKKILSERREDFLKITQAWDKALQYAQSNPDDAYHIMGKREGITADEFKQAITDMKVLTSNEQRQFISSLPSTLKKTRDVLVESQVLPNNISADCCINLINR